MQQEGTNPAKRLYYFIFAVMYPLLSSCGGGGGSTASVPPNILSPILNIEGGLAEVGTANLFNDINGNGARWISLVDSDNGFIPIRGLSKLSADSLSKLPDPKPLSGVTTRYSKIAYLQPRLSTSPDPGHYMVWGNRSDQPVQNIPLAYNLKGQWTCVQCTAEGTLRHGALTGLLTLNPSDNNADLNLSGDGLSIYTKITLASDKTSSSRLLPTKIHLDGTLLTPIRSDILGTVFGQENQEAGLVFGIADSEGRVISGGATGTLNKETAP